MSRLAQKEAIEEGLKGFTSLHLEEASLQLLNVLGYKSEKRIVLRPNNADSFLETFVQQKPFNKEQALVDEWESVDFLFQLTDAEIQSQGQGSFEFSSKGRFEGENIESYLFFAIELKKPRYTRTQLSAITRTINRLFSMPVMLLFRHGDTITFSIIRRRIHKRDESKDVLEKVTLIKDVRFAEPLRAHIEILNDLSLAALYDEFYFHNFVGLHQAWEKRLDTYALNKRFYREIADWYFWATQHADIIYPRDVKTEDGRSIFLIRLLTRLIFCWFLQEKGLIPHGLFRRRMAEKLLHDFSQKAGTYYRAFLQNLFFATLNQDPEKRGFRLKAKKFPDPNRGVTNLYRYANLLRQPEDLLEMFKSVPFVNGGLFDCLDEVYQSKEETPNVRLDDFSEEKKNSLCIPNELFFGEERELDLSEVYGDKRRKKEKVSGLIEILNRYKFTVEENTPLEQEIALDPELLGKVFENLLASYNEDTRTTARKATGSYYTPREIVNYMVDETLIAYLNRDLGTLRKTSLTPTDGVIPAQAGIQENSGGNDSEVLLRQVFSAAPEHFQNPLSAKETEAIIHAIDRVKILDPACGSGAFPMGALHRLVDLLQKLDPRNEQWREIQRQKAIKETEEAYKIGDQEERQRRLIEIDEVFEQNASDYGRKLYLIENCIYGVDIQPIACQIAKLRFFIALIVDQNMNPKAPNFGVRPLPNLETKIVAANTLLNVERPQFQLVLPLVGQIREELDQIRHAYFNARSPSTKAKCREQDSKLRRKLADLLSRDGGLPDETAHVLAGWDPYDQNAHTEFFDPEWMFGLKPAAIQFTRVAGGVPQEIKGYFDIIFGNPPYVRQEQIKDQKPVFKNHYDCFTGTADLYVYFYERSIKLLKPGGAFAFITSNKWYRAAYGEKLRAWLAGNTRILQLIDFGDAPVFTAISYPTIMILQRITPSGEEKTNEIRALNWQPGPSIEDFAELFQKQSFSVSQSSLKSDGWRLESRVKLKLLERIRSAGVPLGEYVKGRLYRGILTGLNEAFVVDRTTRNRLVEEHPSSAELLKPFLRGRDVKRWKVDFKEQYLIKIESSENIEHPWSNKTPREAEKIFSVTYPAIHTHFHPSRKALMERWDQGQYFWELRACAYWREFERPKIIYPNICQRNEFAWDGGGYYANQKAFIIPDVAKYILGILNSSLWGWLFEMLLAKLQNGFFEPSVVFLKDFPIVKSSDSQSKLLELIVEYLQWLNTTNLSLAREIDSDRDSLMQGYFEQLLNGLVYELFFQDDLLSHKIYLFKQVEEARFPALAGIPEKQHLSRLQEIYERISDDRHPIRGCLETLKSLDVVRIIEGEE
jgi:adenine-specific DNA-methyltransferase